jgi:hypothetical protein
MLNPYFLTLELVVLALFILCLRHAWRGGWLVVWQLLAGVIFGVLLEAATLQQLHAYHYGRFAVMLGDVPLAVGVAWGCIIYSARLFSDASSLPDWARPVLDGLLALNIDLAMDALAIRLGMWDWGLGLEADYFGVPYANFWAWFWVVYSFSFGLRLFAYRRHWLPRWLGPLAAIVIGLIGVTGTNALIAFVVPRWGYAFTIAVMLAGMVVVVFSQRPRFAIRPVDALVFWVPLGFHVYFLLAGLVSGAIFRPPFLLGMSLAMLALALYWHRAGLKALAAWRPAAKH